MPVNQIVKHNSIHIFTNTILHYNSSIYININKIQCAKTFVYNS